MKTIYEVFITSKADYDKKKGATLRITEDCLQIFIITALTSGNTIEILSMHDTKGE